MIMSRAKNVLGEDLEVCSTNPLTGFYRDGCCNTGRGDVGLHIVCAEMTQEFLEFSRRRGNDLVTPNPLQRCCLGLRYAAGQLTLVRLVKSPLLHAPFRLNPPPGNPIHWQ